MGTLCKAVDGVTAPTILVLDRLRLRRAAITALVTPWAETQGLRVVAADPDELHDIDDQFPAPLVALLNIGGGSIRDNWHAPLIGILRNGTHDVPCIILSDRNDPEEVVMAAQQGIKGFLPATIAPELALQTIAFVIQGGTYFPREAFLREVGSTPVGISSQILLPSLGQLTRRQCEVLERLRVGLSNKSIGRDLDMQESTVKVHVRQIMRKLGAHNRTQAAMLAGRLDPDETTPDQD